MGHVSEVLRRLVSRIKTLESAFEEMRQERDAVREELHVYRENAKEVGVDLASKLVVEMIQGNDACEDATRLRAAARKMCMLCDDRVRGHCFDTCPLYEYRENK